MMNPSLITLGDLFVIPVMWFLTSCHLVSWESRVLLNNVVAYFLIKDFVRRNVNLNRIFDDANNPKAWFNTNYDRLVDVYAHRIALTDSAR